MAFDPETVVCGGCEQPYGDHSAVNCACPGPDGFHPVLRFTPQPCPCSHKDEETARLREALKQVTALHERLVEELKVQYRDAEAVGWLPPAVESRMRKVIARSRGRAVIDDDDDAGGNDLGAIERILDKAARKRAALKTGGTP